MVDIWNILRVWILFSFFKKYWNLLWQEVNLFDSKLDSIKVYLLALIGEVQSSLYSRFSLALWHGLSGFSFKKVFTLASWNLKDFSLMKTLIIVLYKSLIVVLCLVLWNLMFYTCNFVCGRRHIWDLCADTWCFLSFSVLLLPLWCSVPQIPAASLPQTPFSLSLLSKTASCAIVLMVLPCRKCDHSVRYLIVCSLLQIRVLHCMLSNNNCFCIFSSCLVECGRRIFSVTLSWLKVDLLSVCTRYVFFLWHSQPEVWPLGNYFLLTLLWQQGLVFTYTLKINLSNFFF